MSLFRNPAVTFVVFVMMANVVWGQNKIFHQLAAGTTTGAATNTQMKVIGSIGATGFTPQAGQKNHSGFFTIAYLIGDLNDTIPPVIAFTPTLNIARGADLNLSATVTDAPFGHIVVSKVFYRAIGNQLYDSLPLTRNGTTTTYTETIDADKFDAMGLEYYFTAIDASNNRTRQPPKPTQAYTYVKEDARIPASLLSFGKEETNYRMISVPHDYTENISTLLQGLGDHHPTKWRLLTHVGNGRFAEYPGDFSTFERAKGYWLIATESKEVNLAQARQAPENNQSSLYEAHLIPGWNQVGNPYTVAIDWDNVREYHANVQIGPLKIYTGGYDNKVELLPYQGGYVYLDGNSAQTIKIPFKGQTLGSRKSEVKGVDGRWQLPLTVTSSETVNKLGGIGMHARALVTKDRFDDHNPPSFSAHAEINFAHPEHPLKSFSFDVVPVLEEYVWSFKMTSSSGEALLEWDASNLPADLEELYLYDESAGEIIDMRASGKYESTTPRNLKIYYGKDARSKIRPSDLWVSEPYPNPFRDETTIAFGLPGDNDVHHVCMEIYNAQGQPIRRLVDGTYLSGFHEVKWNGQANDHTPAASGMYFYRVAASSGKELRVETGRIIITR
jgi:hypothetical protein